jgi:hypothetical protein
MFNKPIKKLLFLTVVGVVFSSETVLAVDAKKSEVSVDASALPVNVSAPNANAKTVNSDSAKTNALVSPSQAQQVSANAAKASAQVPVVTAEQNAASVSVPQKPQEQDKVPVTISSAASEQNTIQVQPSVQPKPQTQNVTGDFDLKMKAQVANSSAKEEDKKKAEPLDLPKNIQYTVDPVENLGNDVLSQMDSDLFTQMSEIEKSTTLLTLELRREKLRNEIEAQKAIRQKSADDLLRQQEEEKLKNLEKKKQIEARILQEKQLILDKEKVLELLKQRKLLNAYMNEMLVQQQKWLKEKENLYAQLAAVEQEKKDLVVLFRQRIDKVLEASNKNIQAAEAAKANFERIVKGLKTRNEQLRKRIEADAKIIKNAKNNLYIQAQSIEELKDKKAAATDSTSDNSKDKEVILDEEQEEEDILKTLSSEYAILGIVGRAGVMSVDLIDKAGQSLSLKLGSTLPSGHVVSDIGADYVKFTRDGRDDFLYVGKTIDGIVPTLDVITVKGKQ